MEQPQNSKKAASVGVIGGAGYTGGELVRLLLAHPGVELKWVQSRSQAGKKVADIHRDLLGQTDLVFSDDTSLLKTGALEVVFLALSHGEAKKLLAETELASSTRIVDLSQDFRHTALSHIGTPGGGERRFVYGLPELRRDEIRTAQNIANPGCFATAIEIALLPLARAGMLHAASVTGITGSTGAGQGLSETVHFSFRANNIQAYKTLAHQHLTEVLETLLAARPHSKEDAPRIHFVPWRGDFTRGIFVSAVLDGAANPKLADSSWDEFKLQNLYREFFASHPFVRVSESAIDLKSVVNTNRAQIELVREKGAIAIHVVLDNLLKGAAGQAVQNMNLMLGFPEDQGLRLKGSVF